MEPLSLQLLPPRTGRPSLPLVTTAPPCSKKLGSTCLTPRRRRPGARRLSSVSAVATETALTEEVSPSGDSGSFDWLDHRYPIAPVCDLDPGAPHGKTVLGLRVVAWHDRGAGEWRVFDDACPHRLAPLSEGRVDGKGRLQCVYHGWCFDGAGARPCRAQERQGVRGVVPARRAEQDPVVLPEDGGRVRGRAAEEAAAVHARDRRPLLLHRDRHERTLRGYDVMMDNLFDPAHVPYPHKGLVHHFSDEEDPARVEHDREGGNPIKMNIEHADIHGFLSNMKGGSIQFVAP